MSSKSHKYSVKPSSSSDNNRLDCPVCFTGLLPPIFQCKNGHLLCNACIKKLKSCPVCRVDLPINKIRNLIAEQVVAKMSTGCPNGCQVVGELMKHVGDCQFRSMRVCQYIGFPECSQELLVKDIVSHLKSAHDLGAVNIEDGRYTEMTQIGSAQAIEWLPVILLSDDYPPFVLKTTLIEDSLSWSISAVHSEGKVCNKLTAKIKLLIDPEEINSLTWKGRINELKTDSVGPNSFSVPMSKMRGLDHWKLLVKISRRTNRKAEREVPQLKIQPRALFSSLKSQLKQLELKVQARASSVQQFDHESSSSSSSSRSSSSSDSD